MTPGYLSRIRAIYESALEKDPAERASFLVEECRGDDALRREVELLLGARQQVPDWLNQPVLAPAPTLDAPVDPVPRMEGRKLSGYTVVREIGRGGMGSVYLAERSDGAFRKQVAIKLVQHGMTSAEMLARFRREREILASLDHPGIARLLDASTTDEGLPYFVMEFVDGRPLDRWCDEHKLNVTQRLELFRKVCDAVQYAHQRLIVHRDLKPANILVTGDGEVKLLDFGIAKILNPEHKGDETTRTLLRLMTPEYASPEQLNGDLITTLSDVYSLGVVLYELLTGHRPRHLLRAAVREMARMLSEEEPTRPSVMVGTTDERITPQVVSAVREGDPNRLRKRLEGDLDCILLTALHSEPVRRYRSVEALADDLGRHLDDRPVEAREDTLWYRASRFVRRHPSGVVTGVLIVLSLVAGLGTTIWEARIVIQAPSRPMSGRDILAPQMALFVYVVLAAFGAATYLTRATPRRDLGALAGGAGYALVWFMRMSLGSELGWWRSRFAETPLQLFLQPAFVLALALGGAVAFLLLWRVSRRFGWRWLALLIAIVALYQAVRERIWFDIIMQALLANRGIVPLLADTALLTLGLWLGYGLMRLISGPAGKDPLARAR